MKQMKTCVNFLTLEKKKLGGHLLISYINYTSTKQKQISQDLG